MRFSPALIVGLVLALAAAGPALAARKPKKPKNAPPPAAAPAPKPNPLSLAGLVGVDEATVKARLGEPELARAEGAGAMWTYRLPDCALFVFFQRENVQPLKVAGASTGPLARGGAVPETDACLAAVKPK